MRLWGCHGAAGLCGRTTLTQNARKLHRACECWLAGSSANARKERRMGKRKRAASIGVSSSLKAATRASMACTWRTVRSESDTAWSTSWQYARRTASAVNSFT